MSADRRQFFFEHVQFPLLVDWRQTTAAFKLWQAAAESDPAARRRLCLLALDDLQKLEDEIGRAERPPFENWYRPTWIRNNDSPYNVHRSYQRTLFGRELELHFAHCVGPSFTDRVVGLEDVDAVV